jgi:hypothetical protein
VSARTPAGGGCGGTFFPGCPGRAAPPAKAASYALPLVSGSISDALAACGMSGWPHFQQ